jgi:hypothetical protein
MPKAIPKPVQLCLFDVSRIEIPGVHRDLVLFKMGVAR